MDNDIEIKDSRVEKCEVVFSKDEPLISFQVKVPKGIRGTEIVLDRNELLHMIDGLNGEWGLYRRK